MLTMPVALKERLSSCDAQPYQLVVIDLGSSNYIFAMCGAHLPQGLIAAPPSIESIDPLQVELDPIGRQVSLSQVSMRFAGDGLIAGYMATHHLVGCPVTIYLGDASLTDSADRMEYFHGIVTKCLPLPGGGAEIVADSWLTAHLDREVFASWAGEHPLRVIYQTLIRAGVPAARIEADDFGGTGTYYSGTKPHLTVARETFWAWKDAKKPEGTANPKDAKRIKAGDVINELARFLPGVLYQDGSGKIRFQWHSDTVSTDAALTDNDIWGVEWEDLDGNMITHVLSGGPSPAKISFEASTPSGQPDNVAPFVYELFDAPAVATHGLTVYHDVPGSEWLGGSCYMSADGTYVLHAQRQFAACGMAHQGVGDEVAALQLTSTNFGRFVTDGNQRVVLHGLVPYLKHSVPWFVYQLDADGVLERVNDAVERHTFTVGSAPVGWAPTDETFLFDVTIQDLNARYILARASYGMPIISLSTGLAWADLDLADVVTIDSEHVPEYAAVRADRVGDIQWQVIGKQLDIAAGEIRWTLARL